MSSRQRLSARAWTVDAAHPRRCPDCGRRVVELVEEVQRYD